jgi:hypothetical protein
LLAWETSESELIGRYRKLLDWQPIQVSKAVKSSHV